MTLRELLSRKREEVLRIAAKHGAYNVRVFGSVARGDDGPDSDIDLLIEKLLYLLVALADLSLKDLIQLIFMSQ